MKTIKLLAYTNSTSLNSVVIIPKDEDGKELQGVLMELSEQSKEIQDKAEELRVIYSQMLSDAGFEDTDVLYMIYKDFSEEYGSEKNSISVQNHSNQNTNTGDLRVWGVWNPSKKIKIDEFATICTMYINK